MDIFFQNGERREDFWKLCFFTVLAPLMRPWGSLYSSYLTEVSNQQNGHNWICSFWDVKIEKLFKDDDQPQSNDLKMLKNLFITYLPEYAVDNGYWIIFICFFCAMIG